MAYHTKEDWRAYNVRRSSRNRLLYLELKSQPCVDCGGKFPHYVMEFDHVPERGVKKRSVGVLMGSQNVTSKAFQEELKKCDLLCANCHKIRTYARRESLKTA